MIRTTLRRLFEQGGWTCSEATDGEDAIAKARQFRPDVIVLDLSMPVMNGLTAGNILKHTLPGTPLILFTSYGAILSSEDVRRAGFSASIGKNDAGKLVMTAQTLVSH